MTFILVALNIPISKVEILLLGNIVLCSLKKIPKSEIALWLIMSCREKGQYPDEEIDLHYQGESSWLLLQHNMTRKTTFKTRGFTESFTIPFSILPFSSQWNTQQSNKDGAKRTQISRIKVWVTPLDKELHPF